MNKRFSLVSLAIVLGICAFIYFTQMQAFDANRPVTHAQSAYGVRVVKNVRVQNYNALGIMFLIMTRYRKGLLLSVSRLMKPWLP